MRYELEDDALSLSPVVTPEMKEPGFGTAVRVQPQGWAVAVSYPGHNWKRVDCSSWCYRASLSAARRQRRQAVFAAPREQLRPYGALPWRWHSPAIADRPELDALALELVQLERRERDISARRRKLHERLDAFPSDHVERQARELSAERRRIHKRIDELRAQLARLA